MFMDKENKKKSNIRFVKGSIFNSKMQTLVNTVNCVGVMGGGLAKKFKEKYPAMFDDYVEQCKSKMIKTGRPTLWKGDRWVLNFPTKDDWRYPSELKWIKEGLTYFVDHYKEWGIESIAFPALGCNLGGLSWIEVRPVMENFLSMVDIPVEIYIPKLTPMERALEYILKEINANYLNDIEYMYVRRSMYPEPDSWTDWKKSKTLIVQIKGNRNAISSLMNKMKSLTDKTFTIDWEAGAKDEEIDIDKENVSIYTVIIKVINK